MKTPVSVTIFKMLCWLLGLYALLLVYLYFSQTALIFQPGTHNPFRHDYKPFQPFVYQTPMGLKEQGLWYPPKPGMPLLVHFHGNGGSIANRYENAKKLMAYGYGVALVEYRGYGGNPGVPSEPNLMEDARAAIMALHRKGVSYREMIFYGESLGTAVAVQMATEFPLVKAVILEAPYTSIVDVAARRFWFLPVRKLVRDQFNMTKTIGALRMPVLVLHGTNDFIVPFEIGKKLFALVRAPQRDFVAIPDGLHNDLYERGADRIVDGFVRKIK